MFYNFEDTIVHWYRYLLLEGINSTESTGEENHLLAAYGYGLTPSTTLHKIPPIYPYYLSLLSLGTFLATWLYCSGKHQIKTKGRV